MTVAMPYFACFALAGATALLLAGTVRADPPSTIRLSPKEIARIQDEAAAAPARGVEEEDERPRKRIHGEVGMSIGTGGARELYGAAELPLGEDVRGAVSMGVGRWPKQRPARRNRDRY